MTHVQHEELSALLDGELASQRAEVVRAGIDADPALRREFDALARLDSELRGVAAAAAFMPDVSLPAARDTSAGHWLAGVAVALALIAARLLPKLAEPPLFGVGLQVAVCAVISFIVVRMVREAEPHATLSYGKGIAA